MSWPEKGASAVQTAADTGPAEPTTAALDSPMGAPDPPLQSPDDGGDRSTRTAATVGLLVEHSSSGKTQTTAPIDTPKSTRAPRIQTPDNGQAEDLSLVEQRMDDWRRRLIDLSGRNRLIAYRPTKATTLEIVAPSLHELLADPDRAQPWDFFFPPEADDQPAEEERDAADTVDELIVSEASRPSRGANQIEVSEPNPKRIARVLDNLAKRSNTEFQDKALRILYIAAGFLDWHDEQRDKDVTSPLVLVPVELGRESTRHPYRLYVLQDEEIVINPSLTEKLRRDSGLEVPEDWVWEDKPIEQELDEIRQAIEGTGWTVRDQAVLGLFSFQKYVMYRDLFDHEAEAAAHPVVRSLAQGRLAEELAGLAADMPAEDGLDEVQQPADSYSILDADASQRLCLEAAKRGRSFVMQGPPGTGKSQTIANVIAEAIGQGKRVLFVSEKAAALDVVYKRLASRGLDEYCLNLHGEHAARREVVHALDRSLTTALRPRRGMRADEMERLWNLRLLLNDSAELIHLPQSQLGGRTLREVHEQLALLSGAPDAHGAPTASDAADAAVLDEAQAIGEVFEALAERWHVSRPDFAWRGYDSDQFTTDDRGRVLATVRRAKQVLPDSERHSHDVADELGWPVPRTLRDADQLAAVTAHLELAPRLEPHWLEVGSAPVDEAIAEARDHYERLREQRSAFAAEFPARTVDDFPEELPRRLSEASNEVRRVGGWPPAWATELTLLGDSLAALAQAPEAIAAVHERADASARITGQPTAGMTLERAEAIAQLAELGFTADQRPDREWLVRAGLARAKETLDNTRSDLVDYQALRGRVLEGGYTADALDLEANALRERFATQYTSVFSKLSSGYRRDARQIKACRSDGKLPATLLDDLTQVEAAAELARRIDEQEPKMRQAFGSYMAGRDTDPAAIAAAVAVAERALELSAPDADLGALGDALAVGSQPTPEAGQAADRLRAAIRTLSALAPALNRFVTNPPDVQTSSLDEIEEHLDHIHSPLTAVAELISDLNRGAAAPAGSFDLVAGRADTIEQTKQAISAVEQSNPRWRELLGDRFSGDATDWEEAASAASWLSRLEQLAAGVVSDPIRRMLTSPGQATRPGFAELRSSVEEATAAVSALLDMFESGRADELRTALCEGHFAASTELCVRLAETVDDLRDWTEWRSWSGRARARGWDAFVRSLAEIAAPAEGVVPALQRAYWHRRLEAFYENDPDLSEDLRGGAFQRWVDEFRELDRELVASGADRLIARREGDRTVHVSTQGSEVALLRREARKKRRHLPVRVLLSHIPTLLSELKPCLLMSPLTVSHFLAHDHRFDLVVFDEASQVPPQDAINCIYRGEQLIVAGDSKQLPPTPFFQVAELDELAPDEEDASTEEDMESMLDACEALLPAHPLRWHYRSRAEPLIAFSNRHLYDDSLVTFPAADAASLRKGVSFVHVADGVYDRGRSATNRREAQVVAQRVMHHLLDGTGRSVGVIAFNTAQAVAISEELDLLKVQHPELEQHFGGDRLDAVFVKHLEAVQGDERDIIVFSVGYGRGRDGKFTMNFGPLNKDGGQRRLNVAVTRARERVEVVSSVRASDFRVSEEGSAGARLLRDYIRYAEAGGRVGTDEQPVEVEREWPSALERAIAAAIVELGYEAVPAVGVGTFRIDIGVRSRSDPERFLLGIECDGHTYANTPTARDRERLRHEVLAELGWGPIHRIWSLDWVRNRHGEIARLGDALAAAERREALIDQARERPADDDDRRPERVEREVVDLDDASSAAALPWTSPYQRARLRPRTSHYGFHESVNRREQTDVLTELLSMEAPISIDYAIRRLAETWGIARAGHRVVAAGRQAISQAGRRKAVEVRGEFLWRPGQALTQVRVPDPDDPATRRDIDDIPPEEIDLAIARLREASAGQSDEQLIAAVARVLGFDRTGERIRTVIAARLAQQSAGG